MYKTLKIGGKDYKMEYTIEASLYDECTEELIKFLGKTSAVSEEEAITNGMDEEQKLKARKELLNELLSGISNIPKVAMTMFYAGLMEYHGSGRNGDKTVTSKEDAKELLRVYFEEHKEDGTDNFYDVLTICLEQMGEDGFFKRTGLEKMVEQSTAKPNREQRRKAAKDSGN